MRQIINFIIKLGAPSFAYKFAYKLTPWLISIGFISLIIGTYGGLFIAPSDYQQNDGYRIIFVHVPMAMLSMSLYMAIGIVSIFYLIWKIKLADYIANAIAPIGALCTFLALFTGAVWGKPMWGTYWVWDPRLTSELILLFLYLGYIALGQVITNQKTKAQVCAILALIGLVDLPVIHYSVYWFNSLHQGATISTTKPQIVLSMAWPLMINILGFNLLILGIIFTRLKTIILANCHNQQWILRYV